MLINVFFGIVEPILGKSDSYQNEKFMRGCRFLEAELQDMDRVLSGRYVSFKLQNLAPLKKL